VVVLETGPAAGARALFIACLSILLTCASCLCRADDAFLAACRDGKLDAVRECLRWMAEGERAVNGASTTSVTDARRWTWGAHLKVTGLFIATREGRCDVVRLLLDDGTATDDWADIRGETVLFVAAREGHREVAQLLLQHGASVTRKNLKARTPADVAAEAGHHKLARMLIDAEMLSDAEMLINAEAAAGTVGGLESAPLTVTCGAGTVAGEGETGACGVVGVGGSETTGNEATAIATGGDGAVTDAGGICGEGGEGPGCQGFSAVPPRVAGGSVPGPDSGGAFEPGALGWARDGRETQDHAGDRADAEWGDRAPVPEPEWEDRVPVPEPECAESQLSAETELMMESRALSFSLPPASGLVTGVEGEGLVPPGGNGCVSACWCGDMSTGYGGATVGHGSNPDGDACSRFSGGHRDHSGLSGRDGGFLGSYGSFPGGYGGFSGGYGSFPGGYGGVPGGYGSFPGGYGGVPGGYGSFPGSYGSFPGGYAGVPGGYGVFAGSGGFAGSYAGVPGGYGGFSAGGGVPCSYGDLAAGYGGAPCGGVVAGGGENFPGRLAASPTVSPGASPGFQQTGPGDGLGRGWSVGPRHQVAGADSVASVTRLPFTGDRGWGSLTPDPVWLPPTPPDFPSK